MSEVAPSRTSTTRTLDAPGCTLRYDIHGDPSDGVPLFLVGSPMDATGFATLRTFFTDRPVVTYDPRGAGRSPRTDGASRNDVAEHSDDIARVIDALAVEQVDVFASSGGAVNALALAARQPPILRTLVAHEPPAATALPDREQALALARSIRQTYDRDGFGPAMAAFIRSISLTGPLPDDLADQAPPDPAMFGLPTEDDGSRDDPLVGLNMPTCLEFEHDVDALRAAPTRVVLAHGAESSDTMTGRAARALAEQLGEPSVEFPSHHVGFAAVDDPMMPGQPEAFAALLRDVLDRPTA